MVGPLHIELQFMHLPPRSPLRHGISKSGHDETYHYYLAFISHVQYFYNLCGRHDIGGIPTSIIVAVIRHARKVEGSPGELIDWMRIGKMVYSRGAVITK